MSPIETWQQPLPHDGMVLSVRACGTPGRPVLMFLHGFPEGAWVWDGLMQHFAQPEHGGWRCVAPNLRGYERSSAPADVRAYRPRHLVQDVRALVDIVCGQGQRLGALVAHDWGGAVAWNLANQHPECLRALVILNAPHPGTLLRELQHNPAQQAASAYMHDLAAPGAAERLSANDFAALFATLEAGRPAPWLTQAVRAQYRSVWQHGLQGALNYYAATPLRPPRPDAPAAQAVSLPPEAWRIEVPTLLLWGQQDHALLPALTEGLSAHIPQLHTVPLPELSHWGLHEDPARIGAEIEGFLERLGPPQ